MKEVETDTEAICNSCGWKGKIEDLHVDETLEGVPIYWFCKECGAASDEEKGIRFL